MANLCSGGACPQCGGSCPAGSTCFNGGVSCYCPSDVCTGPACLCVPPAYTLGNCPPGHGIAFCNEVNLSFCQAGPCGSIGDCPSGDACIDFSACM